MDEKVGIVVFRLDQMEIAITEIGNKIDQLLSQQQQYNTEIALIKQSHKQHSIRIHKLEKQAEYFTNATTDLQINLAQKLGPGAIAGGVVAALMLILKFLVGA